MDLVWTNQWGIGKLIKIILYNQVLHNNRTNQGV